MQSINNNLKYLLLIILILVVTYFFFGTDGKLAQANDKLKNIQETKGNENDQIKAELDIQKSYTQ
jgi:Na+/H+ antiporter NhaC